VGFGSSERAYRGATMRMSETAHAEHASQHRVVM
jgi:hypothetical protein